MGLLPFFARLHGPRNVQGTQLGVQGLWSSAEIGAGGSLLLRWHLCKSHTNAVSLRRRLRIMERPLDMLLLRSLLQL